MDKITGTLPSKTTRKRERRHLPLMFLQDTSMLLVNTETFPHTLVDGDIRKINATFMKILDDLRRDVQRHGIDLSNHEHEYLARLRTAGATAYNHLLPKPARQCIADIRNEAQPRDLSITFTAPPHILPFWEVVYDGGPSGQPIPEHFWGFRYPLGRNYIGIRAYDNIHIQMGIFSSIHNKLNHSRGEVENLASRMQELCQEPGLKLALCLLDQELPGDNLSTEQIIELFNSEDFRYGIVHFACHSWNPPDGDAMWAHLSLTTHDTELEIRLDTLIAWEDYGFHCKPFVFLNACETSTPGRLPQSITMPNTLLKFGAGGVIATACAIPDHFASAFASEFYRRLLNKSLVHTPVNIGEALLETRLYFLHQYNNPLGLAYGLYAASNQKLVLRDE